MRWDRSNRHRMTRELSPAGVRLLVALLASSLAAAAAPAASAEGVRGNGGSVPALPNHRGYEQIVAGSGVDPSMGLPTDPSFVAADVGLSGDGLRVWFVLYQASPVQEHQVWSMLTDATAATQSLLLDNTDSSSTGLNNLFVRTTRDGAIAIFDLVTRFSRAEVSEPLELLFQRGGVDFGFATGNLRVTADGDRFLYVDIWNDELYTVDLLDQNPSPVLLANAASLSYLGQPARTLFAFDMSETAYRFWVPAENHFPDVLRNRYWTNRGTGVLGTPSIVQEETPSDEPWIYRVEATDAGEDILYCQHAHGADPATCWLQNAGDIFRGDETPLRVQITEGERSVGEAVLADFGNRAYVLSDFTSNPYGFFYDTARHTRRVAGSQRLSGLPNPAFKAAELSDDGRILAAPTSLGVYVLHDGYDPPPGFPHLLSVASHYDLATDELVVRLAVQAVAPLERIFTLPLLLGLEPNRSLPQAENPLWQERHGGGVNWSTTFTEISPGQWERRIDMDGKFELLDARYSLRIVLVDGGGTRTSFYDFTPVPIFTDGFESGDTSAWSGTVP